MCNSSQCCSIKGATRGFTLIELMVVVAVIGILVSIAYPNYTEYVRSAARSDAKASLMETAQYLERYHTTNNSYVDAAVVSAVSPQTGAARYNISFSAGPTATTYTVQAVPTGAQAADRCGTLTLSSTGARSPSTTGCW